VKVDYSGYAGMNIKPVVSELTINVEELGVEGCQKVIDEYELKIKKKKDKIAAMQPATKKNKPDIAKLRKDIEDIEFNGDYRAANGFIAKLQDAEKEKRRAEKEAEEEAALAGGKPKPKVAPAPAAAPVSSFEVDSWVEALVKSAAEGSEEAQGNLAKGRGTVKYLSEVRAEVPSMVFVAEDQIKAKLKRAGVRDHALKTIRALLWLPPAILPMLQPLCEMLSEVKLKTEPGGKVTELCTKVASAGPGGKAVPHLVLPVLLSAAAGKGGETWVVKAATIGILKEVVLKMSENCPKQLSGAWDSILETLKEQAGDAKKQVKAAADGALEALQPLAEKRISAESEKRAQTLKENAEKELASATIPPPLENYVKVVVWSCCMEANSLAAAKTAVDAELQPIMEKHEMESVLEKVFDGVADEA